jgi:hypothetical protein
MKDDMTEHFILQREEFIYLVKTIYKNSEELYFESDYIPHRYVSKRVENHWVREYEFLGYTIVREVHLRNDGQPSNTWFLHIAGNGCSMFLGDEAGIECITIETCPEQFISIESSNLKFFKDFRSFTSSEKLKKELVVNPIVEKKKVIKI